MSPRVTPLRQVRERELVAATRALFDEQGIQDAPVEKIAQPVGIARGLIYRHFSSKDELYVLTVTHYLDELAGELEAALARRGRSGQRGSSAPPRPTRTTACATRPSSTARWR